jgi:hypothetical protein
MNAIAAPPPGDPRGNDRFAPDRRDWLRLVGGVMLGAGALVLLIRKQNDWSDWATFFALLIPSAVLFGLAIPPRTRWGLQGWQAAFLVFATLLLLAALLQLVQAANGNPQNDLNLLWTFGVTGAVAVATSIGLRAPFQMLLGAVALLVAWLALWSKILDNPSGDTVRWLLLVLAAIYLGVAVALARQRRPQAADLITVAGVAAVLAGALSFAAAAQSSVGSQLSGTAPKPGQGWNLFLLVVSLTLIAYGSRASTRGPAYVGAAGLLGFIALTGIDLVSRLKGDEAGGVVGWPLILLVGGVLALVLSFVLKPGALGGPGGSTAPEDEGPGLVARPYPEHQAAVDPQPGPPLAQQPPVQPPQQPDQPGGLLDQWCRQPPPGAPPQQ